MNKLGPIFWVLFGTLSTHCLFVFAELPKKSILPEVAVSKAPLVEEPILKAAPMILPTSLSRFGMSVEFNPGIYDRYDPETSWTAIHSILFSFFSVNFAPWGVCSTTEKSFCLQTMFEGKMGLGYGIQDHTLMLNPMIGAKTIFFFGHQRWVGVIAEAFVGYGYSPTTVDASPHFLRLDLGGGLWVNLRSSNSRFSLFLRLDGDPLHNLMTVPAGVAYRF